MKIRVGNKASHGVNCYASGGRVPEDISDNDAPAVMSGKSSPGMGGIDGGKAKPRLDRAGKKGATTVNVIIAGKGDQSAPPAMPPPAPPMAPPMAGPPGPPPMPPGPPMGGPPMMRKHGGRVMKKADGGPVAAGQDDPTEKASESRSVARKAGGRVMDAGAGSGIGRLEKIGKK